MNKHINEALDIIKKYYTKTIKEEIKEYKDKLEEYWDFQIPKEGWYNVNWTEYSNTELIYIYKIGKNFYYSLTDDKEDLSYYLDLTINPPYNLKIKE